jgi:pimeloyl-ACP methyl ester carboxylesterase
MIEFGQQNPHVILLLHGGGLSWWNYREAAQELAERYHVVLPILDGHADSADPFTTIEDNAARLISYIDTHFGGQILAIGGLSLGGQVAVEILSQRKDICRYAFIESALVRPMKLTAALIGPTFGMSYGLIQKKWFARMQADYLGIPQGLFDDYFRDTCAISKADMIAFLKANSLYTIKQSLSETKAKVKIAAGAKEQKNIRDSAKLLHAAIPGSSLEILPGLRHGDLSLNTPAQYAKMLTDWLDA